MITVVGMGRKADDLTLAGAEAIRAADVVVVKSALTHAAEAVGKIRQDAVYCDDLYQSAQNFDQLNEQIVRRLRSYKGKVAFAWWATAGTTPRRQCLTTPPPCAAWGCKRR